MRLWCEGFAGCGGAGEGGAACGVRGGLLAEEWRRVPSTGGRRGGLVADGWSQVAGPEGRGGRVQHVPVGSVTLISGKNCSTPINSVFAPSRMQDAKRCVQLLTCLKANG